LDERAGDSKFYSEVNFLNPLNMKTALLNRLGLEMH
jgi:hypothetical protein